MDLSTFVVIEMSIAPSTTVRTTLLPTEYYSIPRSRSFFMKVIDYIITTNLLMVQESTNTHVLHPSSIPAVESGAARMEPGNHAPLGRLACSEMQKTRSAAFWLRQQPFEARQARCDWLAQTGPLIGLLEWWSGQCCPLSGVLNWTKGGRDD